MKKSIMMKFMCIFLQNNHIQDIQVRFLTYSLRQNTKPKIYRYLKIPNISPGLIEVGKHLLVGLYSGAYIQGLIFGGLYSGGLYSGFYGI